MNQLSTEADPIPNTTMPILSSADVISLADVVSRRAERLGKMISDLETGITARAQEVADGLRRANYPPEDQRTAAATEAAKARAEIAINSGNARWETLRELNAAADSLATTALLFANPVAVLSRSGLGTAERTNYLSQINGAGRVELQNLATFAVATQNRVLGAALLTVIDKLPRRERPFSAAELADRLVGEETRTMQRGIEVIRSTVQKSIVQNRAFERGRTDPVARVKLALNKQKKE